MLYKRKIIYLELFQKVVLFVTFKSELLSLTVNNQIFERETILKLQRLRNIKHFKHLI